MYMHMQYVQMLDCSVTVPKADALGTISYQINSPQLAHPV